MEKAFLVAPSRKCDDIVIKRAVETLEHLGFEAMYRGDIASEFLGHYAGNPERRAAELNEALMSDKSNFVFCVRGGMGSVHILDKIKFNEISNSEKIFLGYSDITLLLNVLSMKTNIRCFHGFTAIKSFEDYHPLTISTFKNACEKKNYSFDLSEEDVLVEGYSKAKIIGGNLSLIERSLGTPFEIETENKILFLEQNYYTGRMIYDILWQLKLAGKFDSVKGIILGYFTNSDEVVMDYLKEFFREFSCPVIFNQPIGHSEPNVTIPLDEDCIIDTAGKQWTISFD